MGRLKKGIHPYKLSESYHTESFNCGRPELNDFLVNHLRRQQQNHLLRAYTLQSDETVPQIMGYYTLSGGSFAKAGMSNAQRKQVPYRDAPRVLLGRLAIDNRLKGKGFGSMMVADAARRVYAAGQTVGVFALTVEAKDEDAADFYTCLGFRRLTTSDNRLILFYPTTALHALIEQYPPLIT